jgi:hypothetical protein
VPNPTPDAERPDECAVLAQGAPQAPRPVEDPWAELARRPHIKFTEHELPEATGGGAFARWKNGDVVIILDPRLSKADKTEGLAKFLEDDTQPRRSS